MNQYVLNKYRQCVVPLQDLFTGRECPREAGSDVNYRIFNADL